jgi:hypothetical protein
MKFDLKYGEKIFLHKVSLFSFIIIIILHIIVAKNLFVENSTCGSWLVRVFKTSSYKLFHCEHTKSPILHLTNKTELI